MGDFAQRALLTNVTRLAEDFPSTLGCMTLKE